ETLDRPHLHRGPQVVTVVYWLPSGGQEAQRGRRAVCEVTFTIVGIDPHGRGVSQRVQCRCCLEPRLSSLLGVFLAAVEHLLDHQRTAVVLLHQATANESVPHSLYGTPSVLREPTS